MFSWSEEKNKLNQHKHRISFATAQSVFDDPLHISRLERIECGEQRWQTTGMAANGVILIVAHTGGAAMTNTSELFPRAEPTAPSADPTSAERLDDEDGEIDYSDIPATTEADWDHAVQGKFYRPKHPPRQQPPTAFP